MLGLRSSTAFEEEAAIGRISICFTAILIVIRGYFTRVSIRVGSIRSVMI